MQIYSETGEYKLYQGSMLDMLEVIAPNSIDSIVTDPPYGLTSITKRFGNENAAAAQFGRDGSFQRLSKGFMGKEWDGSGIEYNPDTWRKCYTVLKSGGYLLAFGGTRTFHRIACAIEDAGFEIRDTIMWLYGSGFPKSMNIGLAIDKKNGVDSPIIGTGKSGAAETHVKTLHSVSEITDAKWFGGEYEIRQAQNEWAGWGTALKPAYEPVIVARKPCEGSCVDNVLMYGVGGINIDECRIPTTDTWHRKEQETNTAIGYQRKNKSMYAQKSEGEMNENGRFPSNVILTYDDTDFNEVCGGMPSENDESAARYYYCAKASKRDRDEGLGKEFDSLELILYCCDGGTEIWKDTITTKEVNPAVRLTDMAASIEKAIAEFGTQPKNDIGLNMLLFGNSILAKFLTENKSITKMGISSITASKILNLLMPYTTKDCIQGANCEMEYGLSLVESAVSSNLLTITIQEKMASVRGAKPVVFKMRYKINEREKHSTHPTVKPVDLMQYLVRLVTPPNGTVLDPFNGSGSTGKAVMYENRDRNSGYKYIGIELTPEYLPIADARIRYAAGDHTPIEPAEQPLTGQITFFDILGGTE